MHPGAHISIDRDEALLKGLLQSVVSTPVA